MGLLESMIDAALKKAQDEADKRSRKSEEDATKEEGGLISVTAKSCPKPRPKSSPNT